MHEHKFIWTENGAVCEHEGCFYVFTPYDILQMCNEIANKAAQQGVQRTCANCGANDYKEIVNITVSKNCVVCSAIR